MGIKAKPRIQGRGHWEENRAPWYEQTAVYCDACGMLIPRKTFVVEQDGVRRRFCGSECARLSGQIGRLNKKLTHQ